MLPLESLIPPSIRCKHSALRRAQSRTFESLCVCPSFMHENGRKSQARFTMTIMWIFRAKIGVDKEGWASQPCAQSLITLLPYRREATWVILHGVVSPKSLRSRYTELYPQSQVCQALRGARECRAAAGTWRQLEGNLKAN